MRKSAQTSFQSIGEIIKGLDLDKNKFISREFQDYGYRLAEELDDLDHKALYIKLAKETPRKLLEQARNLVKDASNVKNKGRLFMWAVKSAKSGQRPYLVSRQGRDLRGGN